MLTRRFAPRRVLSAALSACAIALGAAACAPDQSLAPPMAMNERLPGAIQLPESSHGLDAWTDGFARSSAAHCTRREGITGSALIGPEGGTLVVGNNYLIVPSGALDVPTVITGIVPADTIASILLEPAGLTFRRPAGLILDATGCDVSGGGTSSARDVVYLNDEGVVIQHIKAIFSTLWHTFAAPIDHFSQYAVAV